MVKNLPAMQETQVWSLSWEDPVEKGTATHSSILTRRIPWMEKPGRLQSIELQRVGHNWATNTVMFPQCTLLESVYHKWCWILSKPCSTSIKMIVSSQSYGFSSGHVWMWVLDCEVGWAPKNSCFWTAVLEKTLESPLDCKEIQPVHSEGDQPWNFFGRNDAKAETPVLWPPLVKSWLIGKDSDAGRDWGQEDKGTTEDEMAGWHHWLDGRESEWTPGVGDGQGGLACCNSWGHKELDMTELLN